MSISVYGESPLKKGFEAFLKASKLPDHNCAVIFADKSSGEDVLKLIEALSVIHDRILAVCDYFDCEGADPEAAARLHAVIGTVKAFARSKGIRINLLRYGATDKAHLPDAVALERSAEPWEIFEPILFFAGDGCDFMTGQIIDVNGGIIY